MAVMVNGLFSSPRSIAREGEITESDEYFVRHSEGNWRVYRLVNRSWKLLGLMLTRQEVLVLNTLAAGAV